ncbi:MAG: aspartate kinase [Clostridia bacterium]|nr:aspartate kinase [Clostridia bacterium]
MDIKVVKFGGSSLADAKQFEKVAAIIKADPARRYVVPSAPGKRFAGDDKVTDLLYRCYDRASKGEDIDADFEVIMSRYNDIIRELHLDFTLEKEFAQIKNAFLCHAGRDYAASRGEYLNGLILSQYIGFPFIDAASVIFFNEDGSFNEKLTNTILSAKLRTMPNAVIPGFYGAMPNDTIRTFSRGGSDITGSIVARAADADLYENWTDVSGFLMADPRIVTNPRTIRLITYHELRELSYMGAGVLHEDAIFPVRYAGIPINIRNTNQPEAEGTMIVPDSKHPNFETKEIVTGVAGKKGFCILTLEKDRMNDEVGFGRRVLQVFENHNICFEHLPSGIDTMCVILNNHDLEGIKDMLINEICQTVEPDNIAYDDDLALIAVVGRGMVKAKGTASRVFKAVSSVDVNIRMIDQGSSEQNIIIGVSESCFETALRAIYAEFSEDNAIK